jgi:hypothetical protein
VAIAQVTSGSTTPTVGAFPANESSLTTQTGAAVYQIEIDLSNMVTGATSDILEIRIYSKSRSADTERLIEPPFSFFGAQSVPFFTYTYMTTELFRVGITQTQGTARAFPWQLISGP